MQIRLYTKSRGGTRDGGSQTRPRSLATSSPASVGPSILIRSERGEHPSGYRRRRRRRSEQFACRSAVRAFFRFIFRGRRIIIVGSNVKSRLESVRCHTFWARGEVIRLFEGYELKVDKFGKRKKFLRIINLPLELFSKGAFSNFPPRVSLRAFNLSGSLSGLLTGLCEARLAELWNLIKDKTIVTCRTILSFHSSNYSFYPISISIQILSICERSFFRTEKTKFLREFNLE